jgi:hypothetical protein
MSSIIPELCLYTCKQCKLNPTSEKDRIILHILCFLVLGNLYKDNIISENVTIIAECHGPFIPLVEEWCDQIKVCSN